MTTFLWSKCFYRYPQPPDVVTFLTDTYVYHDVVFASSAPFLWSCTWSDGDPSSQFYLCNTSHTPRSHIRVNLPNTIEFGGDDARRTNNPYTSKFGSVGTSSRRMPNGEIRRAGATLGNTAWSSPSLTSITVSAYSRSVYGTELV